MFVQETALTGCDSSASPAPLDSVVPIPAWKRGLDISFILLFAVFWLPLMCIIAIGIKVASKGPVFFRQERVGYRGRRFLCYKFRSMHCGADTSVHRQHVNQLMAGNAPMVKLDQAQDRRLIPMGQVLRASGLDELPQLFNVLRGEMSLVGPRPCVPYEYEAYEAHQKERFAVLPGLTGLWQVTGKNKTTFGEMIDLDIRYGRNLSLNRDLWILIKTPVVLGGQILESFVVKLKSRKRSVGG